MWDSNKLRIYVIVCENDSHHLAWSLEMWFDSLFWLYYGHFLQVDNMSKGPDANTPPHAEFESLLLIAHYYANRSAFQPHKSLEELATKIAISLLRHTDIIPADKAFYEAGMMCRVIIYMCS